LLLFNTSRRFRLHTGAASEDV